MLGADVVVPHPTRFFEGNLDHLLDTRSGDDLLQDREALVSTEQGLYRLADLADLDAQVSENLGG